ncbi:hypothetical protein SXCC_03601 [Gluconacetobacter sp. SXCC-1]|uniref:DUF1176 domain-containing protein n=1 Tax=Komagataeibacter rhaeticus TaxID=215221 RepID=A0A858JKI0_9PROT|nr:DUF1176 domain-containing protein [Komagataeibacter rhaeticus]EGG75786.1 hypothetical protein SXCC_03601 [Gluconacetobacter sp. SXCC-1]QIP36072.1 DUF1176 domain-containing protein [Komagataeibacter rhaeticus]QOC45834.1 DUF1176 domain-containing protein [Komagataeibacter rhaeticus]
MDTLRHGTLLQVGKESAPVPLRGPVATLSVIDDRQGRANGQTALVRHGPGSASAVPAAPCHRCCAWPCRSCCPGPNRMPLMVLTRRAQARFISTQQCDPPDADMQQYLTHGVYGLVPTGAACIAHVYAEDRS